MIDEERTDNPSAEAAPAGAPDQGAPAPAAGASDEPPAGEAAVDETTAELEHLQRELDSLNDRHLRLAAEFDNYRKRIERERAELRTRAQADLARRLLDVLDDLQRYAQIEPGQTTVEALHQAAEMVERKLRQALEVAGLQAVEAEGEFFNPETMEALMTLPAEHPEDDEVVADVFQKGYRFQDVLIRPARVRVKKYEG